MERMMMDVMRRSAERAYAAAGIASLHTKSMSRIFFQRVKSCKRHLVAARRAQDTVVAFTAYVAWKHAQRDLRKSLLEQTAHDQAVVRSRMCDLRTANPYASWQLLHRMVTRGPLQMPFPLLQPADGTWATTTGHNKAFLSQNFAASGRAPADDDPDYDVAAAVANATRYRGIVRTLSARVAGEPRRPHHRDRTHPCAPGAPRHKARDVEGFRAEHIADLLSGLRHDDPSLTDLPGIQAWLRVFNHILDTSIVPVSWLRQVVIALYKGKDAPDTRATSYRPICVTAHSSHHGSHHRQPAHGLRC
jgi:hypothetical protein